MSSTCVITNSTSAERSAITNTKLYVPVVTLSTQDNANLFQQLKSEFKRTIKWNKYHLKTEPLNAPNPYLDFLIEPSFQRVNRLFALPFNFHDNRIGHSRCCLLITKVKDYNVIIDGKNFFDEPIKSYIKTYETIRKATAGQGNDYTIVCLVDYNYFKKHKMIAIDLSKQQALDADPNAIQKINLLFFIIDEVKETILDFLQGTVKVE